VLGRTEVRTLTRWHAGEQQASHIAPPVADLLERIVPAKALDREIRLERQQLTDIRPSLVTPSEMTGEAISGL